MRSIANRAGHSLRLTGAQVDCLRSKFRGCGLIQLGARACDLPASQMDESGNSGERGAGKEVPFDRKPERLLKSKTLRQ